MDPAETQAPHSHLTPGAPADSHDLEDTHVPPSRRNGEVVFEPYEPNGDSNRDGSEDVEMG